MQPPLPKGTLLQNRYRIDRVLGSGGFGRTYIAEDSNMYDELCVLKEYNPSVQGTYALKKSKELFEREAKILYQIKHPQIPKFRATFEQAKRLFLLQDYVKGKTYRSLLDERLANKQKFSQKEVVEFLEQMLPVLTYIHSKDIIHRDISPDNIILPEQTSPEEKKTLPVLIDFGAVKEIGEKGVNQSGESEGSVQGTTVGKLGYSPPEQLQTGNVAPNSDIYALAATAIVLMTGRKPEELLNEKTMMPCWTQWVPTLDSRLSLILNKMMSYRPENRYQSASEAFNALRSSKDLMFQEKKTSLQLPVQDKPSKPATPSKNNRKTTSPSLFKTLWNHPLTSKVMGGGLVFLVTVAVSLSLRPPENLRSEPSEGSSPSEEISTSPEATDITPISSPDATTTPTMQIKRNMFAGDTVNEANRLQAGQLHRYQISGTPGKLLSVKLLTGRVEMKVLDSNEQPMNKKDQAEWQGTMLSEGVYIDIASEEGSSSKYELEISVKEP